MKTTFIDCTELRDFHYYLPEKPEIINIYKLNKVDYRTLDIKESRAKIFDFIGYIEEENDTIFFFVDEKGFKTLNEHLNEYSFKSAKVKIILLSDTYYITNFEPTEFNGEISSFSISNREGLNYVFSLHISQQFIEIGNYELSFFYLKVAVKNSKELSDSRTMIPLYYCKLRLHSLKNEYKNMIISFNALMNLINIFYNESTYYRTVKYKSIVFILKWAIKNEKNIDDLHVVDIIERDFRENTIFTEQHHSELDEFFQVSLEYYLKNTKTLETIVELEFTYRKKRLSGTDKYNDIKFGVVSKQLGDLYLSKHQKELAHRYFVVSLQTFVLLKEQYDNVDDLFEVVYAALTQFYKNNKKYKKHYIYNTAKPNEDQGDTAKTLHIKPYNIFFYAHAKAFLFPGSYYKLDYDQLDDDDVFVLDEFNISGRLENKYIFLLDDYSAFEEIANLYGKRNGTLGKLHLHGDDIFVEILGKADLYISDKDFGTKIVPHSFVSTALSRTYKYKELRIFAECTDRSFDSSFYDEYKKIDRKYMSKKIMYDIINFLNNIISVSYVNMRDDFRSVYDYHFVLDLMELFFDYSENIDYSGVKSDNGLISIFEELLKQHKELSTSKNRYTSVLTQERNLTKRELTHITYVNVTVPVVIDKCTRKLISEGLNCDQVFRHVLENERRTDANHSKDEGKRIIHSLKEEIDKAINQSMI